MYDAFPCFYCVEIVVEIVVIIDRRVILRSENKIMSRRSRRKTISHADLEDFLCDLGDDSDVIKDSMDVDKAEFMVLGNHSSVLTGKESMSDEQRVREFHKVRNATVEGNRNDLRVAA